MATYTQHPCDGLVHATRERQSSLCRHQHWFDGAPDTFYRTKATTVALKGRTSTNQSTLLDVCFSDYGAMAIDPARSRHRTQHLDPSADSEVTPQVPCSLTRRPSSGRRSPWREIQFQPRWHPRENLQWTNSPATHSALDPSSCSLLQPHLLPKHPFPLPKGDVRRLVDSRSHA